MNSALPDHEVASLHLIRQANLDSPPVDLAQIVSLWPGLTIVEEDLDGEGYLLELGSQGGEILVKRQDNPSRKRFTVAHEIGHWVLRSSSVAASPPANGRAGIERWCDSFGASLLMPREWLGHHLMSGGLGALASRIDQGPSVFQVSAEAFRLRVSQTTDVSVFDMTRHGAQWRVNHAYLSPAIHDEIANHAVKGVTRIIARGDEPGVFVDQELDVVTCVRQLKTVGRASRWLALVKPR